jgi:HK97 family phage prohead protease
MTEQLERRMTRGMVEARANDGGSPRIGGYAAKFRTLSQNLGGFVETIAPGFFDASRDDGFRGVMARYNHELLLGTTAAGSLRMQIDDTGLDYETDLLDDAASLRVLKLVERGDVHQSSFAFYTLEDEWGMTEQGFPLRTLLRGKLVDVAPVDSPAYLDTSTGLRSLADKRELELAEVRALADAGELGKLLTAPPTVIDLGAGTSDSGTDARGETPSAPVRLLALRRALEDETAD